MTAPLIIGVKRKSVPKIKDEVEYYQHQADGIRQMLTMTSCLLADDMGLGKCVQALTVAACALIQNDSRILIVTPASLKGNWEEEIQNFGRQFSCEILDGAPTKRSKQLAAFSKDVLIVNYEQVVSHVATLNAMRFDMTIYDEAHYLKGRKSERTKACMRLTQPRHFLLTGSPLLNQVDDLWTLLHRIAPGDFPSYWTFINRYAVYGGYQDKQIVGVKNEKELRERVAKYMIRREKKDCLDLPGKQIIQVKLDMHAEQKKLYDQAADEMVIANPNDLANPYEIENGLVKLLKLKQICGTTATIPGHADYSSKLDRAVEMCQEFIGNGHAVVVFTQFREVLACMERRLDAVNIPHASLHGGVKISDRQAVVKSWEQAKLANKPQVMLGMWQVMGVGMNLTAASTIIAIDKLFVPKLNEQGYDRCDRIGQTNVVQIYELIMRKSIEARIEQILKRKEGIFGAIVAVDDSNWKRKLIEAVKYDTESEDS